MKNFKVTFNIGAQGIILNRFTTLDSILLATYYNIMRNNGKEIAEMDLEHKTVDFIKKVNGTFSGSIWYIPKDNDVVFVNKNIIKVVDESMSRYTSSLIPSKGAYKQQLIQQEIMLTDKIYFYITAKEKELTAILNVLKGDNLGKKRSLGYGVISIEPLEEMEEEYGFKLDEKNPSKPLPSVEFEIDNVKTALWRRMPPYYSNENLEVCHMPNTILYEERLNTKKSKFKSSKTILNPIMMTKKVFTSMNTSGNMYSLKSVKSMLGNKNPIGQKINNNTMKKCALTGLIEPNGIEVDVRIFFDKFANSFPELKYLDYNTGFLSETALWMMDENIPLKRVAICNRTNLVEYKIKATSSVGKNISEAGGVVGMVFQNRLADLKPPFIHQLATDKKLPAHLLFKNRLSISQGFFFVQFGDRRLEIDGELLLEAYDEYIAHYNSLGAKKAVPRVLLAGDPKYYLGTENNTVENRKFISYFRKKYNQDILIYLSQLTNINIELINTGSVFTV